MAYEFQVQFGDDFNDHVKDICSDLGYQDESDVESLIENALDNALSDKISDITLDDLNIYKRTTQVTDYFSTDGLASDADVESLNNQLRVLQGETLGIRLAMVALVTALAQAGIVPTVTTEEVTEVIPF